MAETAIAPSRATGTFDRAYLLLLALGLMFLPFTRGLSIDLGFPLKVYEPLFGASILTFLVAGAQVEQQFLRRYFAPLFAFLAVASISYVRAVYADTGFGVGFRGGVRIDGALRLAYVALNLSVLVLCFHNARRHVAQLADFWLLGTVLSASYAIYCAFALTLTGEAFLLPGLERHQLSNIGPIELSRSGTFEEGNFAGLYFLLSVALAFWRKRWFVLALAVIGIVISKSTAAYIALVVVAGVYSITVSNRRILLLLPYMAVAGLIVFGIYNYFEYEGKFSGAQSSGVTRLNETMTALEMWWHHPIIGVGLGQYGFLFDQYQWDPLAPRSISLRRIPNNIYGELLSETGAAGFACFVVFAAAWLRAARRTPGRARIFFAAGAGVLVVAFAYPSFNIALLWAFLGIALGVTDGAAERYAAARVHARSARPAPVGAD